MKMKKLFFGFATLLVLAFNMTALVPKAQAADDKINVPVYIAANCHDMKKTGNDDFTSQWFKCEAYQSGLKGSFGDAACGNLFYAYKVQLDPKDSSLTEEKWYTSAPRYTACVQAAQAKLDFIKSGTCQGMSHSSSTSQFDGDDWKNCEKAQNALLLLNCSDHMFKPDPGDDRHWSADSSKVSECQDQINAALNAKIKFPDGTQKPAKDAPAPPEGSTGGGVKAAGTTGDPADEGKDIDCESGTFSLTWIVCPVFEFGMNLTDYVFKNVLQPIMENVPVGTDANNGTYRAWQGFRLIGNIILIGSLLAVVYAQLRDGS